MGDSHVHRPKVSDGHHHDHGHSHAHTQSHRPKERRRLLYCILLTGLMMIAEGIGGYLTNSLALLSDAGHMLTHVAALAVSYGAIRVAARPPTKHATYGYYRVEILAALFNAISIVIICAFIAYEAYHRLLDPQPVLTLQMSIVAVIGLIVNVATAFMLHGASKDDLNVKGAYIHMLGDTFSSVAVIAGGIVMYTTGWFVVDPLLSILICLVILAWAYGLTRASVRVLMEATPRHVRLEEVERVLRQGIAVIVNIHDIHCWEITSGMYAMTAHVKVADCSVADTMRIRQTAEALLDEHFDITHVILQFEC